LKITDVEAVVLRQRAVNEGIADGSQDDLVILIQTDEGITGIGEVDSAPEAVAALVTAPGSHAIANSLRQLLIGEDPLDVERLWDKMYRGVIFIGRRGIAIHAISGIDIALWDIKGKALGKPVCELLGPVRHERIRAYASQLMPSRRFASRGSRRSSSAGAHSEPTPTTTSGSRQRLGMPAETASRS
jgi:L-rhamnonate dehydratase